MLFSTRCLLDCMAAADQTVASDFSAVLVHKIRHQLIHSCTYNLLTT